MTKQMDGFINALKALVKEHGVEIKRRDKEDSDGDVIEMKYVFATEDDEIDMYNAMNRTEIHPRW